MHCYDPIAIARTRPAFDFHEFAPFNGASFAVYHGTDVEEAEWEIHHDTDEWLMLLEGSVTIEILTDTDRHLVPLTPGQFMIVPRGHWHRHTRIRDVVEIYFTPGTYEVSTAADPRLATDA